MHRPHHQSQDIHEQISSKWLSAAATPSCVPRHDSHKRRRQQEEISGACK